MKTVRLNAIDDWNKVGKGVEFIDTKTRKVRILLNVDGIASVFWKQGRKRKFVALVQGLTAVEFDATGKGTIECDGAEAWWRATEAAHRPVGEPGESFAQPHEPRHRNPELELMLAKMQQNSDLRFKQMERMYERRISEVERKQENEHSRESVEKASGEGDGSDKAKQPDGSNQGGSVPEPAPDEVS